MKTRIHYYRYNVSKPDERKAYEEMVDRIKADAPSARGKWMNAWGGKRDTTAPGTYDIEIETSHLFDNQWNSTTSRVFDWYEEYREVGRDFKTGHWLEITPEMASARLNTCKCGYCGAQYGPFHDVASGAFCVRCLDSEYLEEKDLRLLRLRPLTTLHDFPELTDSERAELLPQYVSRQTSGNVG